MADPTPRALGAQDPAHSRGLTRYLTGTTRLASERATWGGGLIHLELAYYLTDRVPPVEYVTSVRCLLFNGDSILVERDLDGVHIVPGGRREEGETLEQTLRREVLEETGWTIDVPRMLGCLHFHHLSPKPPGYTFQYPDFLQPIFTANAVDYRPDQRAHDDYVVDAAFRSLSEAAVLRLPDGQLQLLAAALRRRGNPAPRAAPHR